MVHQVLFKRIKIIYDVFFFLKYYSLVCIFFGILVKKMFIMFVNSLVFVKVFVKNIGIANLRML